MALPAWVPPQIPESEAPPEDPRPNRRAVVVIVAIATLLVGVIGAAAWQYRPTSEPTEADDALELVDAVLTDMGDGRWDDAFARFDQACIDFEASDFRNGFEPFFDGYRDHGLVQLRGTSFEIDQIVLIRGWVDLGGPSDNPVRAELVYGGASTESLWSLCGLRIDEP